MENQESQLNLNIDSILFDKNDEPVPVAEDEYIAYKNSSVSFFTSIGSGIPIDTKIFSYSSGTIFLTNYRVIFYCKDNKHFQSFFTPLNKIVRVKSNDYITVKLNSNIIATVYINILQDQRNIFYDELLMLQLQGNTLDDNREKGLKEIPLYCDVKDKFK